MQEHDPPLLCVYHRILVGLASSFPSTWLKLQSSQLSVRWDSRQDMFCWYHVRSQLCTSFQIDSKKHMLVFCRMKHYHSKACSLCSKVFVCQCLFLLRILVIVFGLSEDLYIIIERSIKGINVNYWYMHWAMPWCMHSYTLWWIMVMPFMRASLSLELINSILNTAAWLVGGIESLINFAELHWIPMWRHTDFKILLNWCVTAWSVDYAPFYLRRPYTSRSSLSGWRSLFDLLMVASSETTANNLNM